MNPIVAIVGRPNVGKSTLFNRLIGKRKAITFDIPGVTRDRHYGDVSWNGRDYLCVDTGGFFGESHVSVNKKVLEQIEIAIQEACVVLFVLDAQAGFCPEDRMVLQTIRKSGKPFLPVINKIDQESHETALHEFYELGVDKFYSISAEHGRKIGDLLDAIQAHLPPLDSERKPKGKEIRISLIGRPNVGKSSLLNCLTGTPRAVVDEVAGTTRDVVDSLIQIGKKKYRMLDTMGIRRGGKTDSILEGTSILLAERAFLKSDVALLVLDAGEGIANQEAHIAGLASQGGCGIIILVNKWDLSKSIRGEKEEFEEKIRYSFKFLPFAPILFVSAKSGLNTPKILPLADLLYKEMGLQWSRERLMEVLEEAIERHTPPVAGTHPLEFRRVVQTGQYPPTLDIAVNVPDGIHFSYERYLLGSFRKGLGLKAAPLKIRFTR